MPDKNPSYFDLALKRQVVLERLKSGQVKEFTKEIKKVEKLLRQTLLLLDDEVSGFSSTKVNKLLRDLQHDQTALFQAGVTNLTKNLADISALYAVHEVNDLTNTVDLRGTKLNAFTKKELFSKVIKQPLTTDGNLLQPWLKDFTTREVKRTSGVVRAGWAQGKTNQQLVQELAGTKARRYKDGVLDITRRNAETVVRTAIQHVSSAAQHAVWEDNQDVVKEYRFVATLDGDTSRECRALDGQVFPFGRGPVPPIHPRCRSRTVGVLQDKFSFLSEGRTRSAEGGPVSTKTNYYDWLKRQSKEVQEEVLGPTRTKLFRDGGMSAERFRKLQFDKNFEPLTLDEMRKLEPKAFEKAGL